MIIYQSLLLPFVIVSLPTIDANQYPLAQPDYNIPYRDCQQHKNKHLENTLDYNYFTTEKYIEHMVEEYNTIIP